jgi:uncharacterized protein YrrD
MFARSISDTPNEWSIFMIFSSNGLHGFKLHAKDGELGHIHDFLFDDSTWTVRYLVADTGWIFGRRVLLAPESLGHPDAESSTIPVMLTKEDIRNSPDIDTDKPVSRQHETTLYGYYGWAPYWGGLAVPPGYIPPPYLHRAGEVGAESEEEGDSHLRSMREVAGYTIGATDGDIGTVEDLLIDSGDWNLRYVVVDTGKWLAGKKVLVSPQWASEIDWADRTIYVTVDKAKVRNAPEYDPSIPLDRRTEERVYGHYGMRAYW